MGGKRSRGGVKYTTSARASARASAPRPAPRAQHPTPPRTSKSQIAFEALGKCSVRKPPPFSRSKMPARGAVEGRFNFRSRGAAGSRFNFSEGPNPKATPQTARPPAPPGPPRTGEAPGEALERADVHDVDDQEVARVGRLARRVLDRDRPREVVRAGEVDVAHVGRVVVVLDLRGAAGAGRAGGAAVGRFFDRLL